MNLRVLMSLVILNGVKCLNITTNLKLYDLCVCVPLWSVCILLNTEPAY
jgi:hypothetical protein